MHIRPLILLNYRKNGQERCFFLLYKNIWGRTNTSQSYYCSVWAQKQYFLPRKKISHPCIIIPWCVNRNPIFGFKKSYERGVQNFYRSKKMCFVRQERCCLFRYVFFWLWEIKIFYPPLNPEFLGSGNLRSWSLGGLSRATVRIRAAAMVCSTPAVPMGHGTRLGRRRLDLKWRTSVADSEEMLLFF